MNHFYIESTTYLESLLASLFTTLTHKISKYISKGTYYHSLLKIM
jgi:hypothetical protein